ncbi:MAG: putative monovalent cation/H+ antiporter subunit A [Chthoniobacterales bacterium]
MLTALAIVALLAALAPTLHRFLRDASGWCFAAVPAGIFFYFGQKLLALSETGPTHESTPWIPSLGVELSFLYDGLSLLFVLLISGIGTLIFIYAGGYLKSYPQRGRFFCFLSLFMGAMLGVVTAENLITLFIFWELTSLSSYLLIGFNHEKPESRAAALQAFLVTFTGGQAMLVAFILMGFVGGTYSLTELMNNAALIQNSSLYVPILLLLLGGAFTKSAQTPFHFWLPGAMAAPTPVSAYLHSATMVTAGVFLLARVNPILGGTPLWSMLLIGFGMLTMLTGAILSVGQIDLKKLLAYSTVSALGTLVMLLGVGSELAIEAAALYLVVHSLYKGALFMIAGGVDHETGTRDVSKLGGLFRSMPLTAAVAGIAALSMCGIPPALGFLSKELMYEAGLKAPTWQWLLVGSALISNALAIAVGATIALDPFYGEKKKTPKAAHEVPVSLWLGPTFLALSGLILGILPWLISSRVVGAMRAAILNLSPVNHSEMSLYLWHGFTPMLALSGVTVALGAGLYFSRKRIRQIREMAAPLNRFGPEHSYNRLLGFLVRFSDLQTRFFQHGYLRFYVMTVIGVATAAILLGLTRTSEFGGFFKFEIADVELYEVLIVVAIFTAGIAATIVRGRLVSVALLSVIGYSIALIFALYGAPDLAFTQFLVETLTLILFVLVLYHLPKSKELSSKKSRIRDGIICSLFGIAVALMVLQAQSSPKDTTLPDYFMENSLVAKGHNVVNVILVDFRALDTLGEVTVLALAGIGVFALLKLRRRSPKPEKKN